MVFFHMGSPHHVKNPEWSVTVLFLYFSLLYHSLS